jgi:ribosomal protein S18
MLLQEKKRKNNWNQSYKRIQDPKVKVVKPLKYLLFVKRYGKVIKCTKMKLLKGFLDKLGKIKGRRQTKLHVQSHHKITKAIKQARSVGLIPQKLEISSTFKRIVRKKKQLGKGGKAPQVSKSPKIVENRKGLEKNNTIEIKKKNAKAAIQQ